MSWENVELRDVSEYRNDRIETNLLNEKNYVSTENILPNKGGIVDSSYPPSGKNSPKFNANDILVSNIRPYFKKIWFAQNEGGCSNDVIVFKPNKKKIDPKFLYFQLSKDEFFDYMMSGANGTKMPRGNKKAIPKFKFSIPTSLETQKRIAFILSNYDDLIENNLKRIKLLEDTAQNIYKEWFVNFRFPNYEHTEFDAESGLPVGWENCRLTDIFDIQGGTQPPKSEWKETFEDGYVRMIQIRDYYTDSHIGFVKDKTTLKKCLKEDIMIARYGASVGRICWGLEGAYNVALAKVIPVKTFFLSYLRWLLKSDYFQSSLLGMTQRTAQDGFNKETFNSIYAIKPDEKTLIQFENIELNLFFQIEKLKEKNQKLKEARDIILPRLMNRTIEV